MKNLALIAITLSLNVLLWAQNKSINNAVVDEFKSIINFNKHITFDSIKKKDEKEYIKDLDSSVMIEKYTLYYSCGDLANSFSFGKYNKEIVIDLAGYFIYDFIINNIDSTNIPNLKLIKDKIEEFALGVKKMKFLNNNLGIYKEKIFKNNYMFTFGLTIYDFELDQNVTEKMNSFISFSNFNQFKNVNTNIKVLFFFHGWLPKRSNIVRKRLIYLDLIKYRLLFDSIESKVFRYF